MRNETDITIVLIEPRRIRNCSRLNFLKMLDEIIAAVELPSPGRSEHIGEIMMVVSVGFISSVFGIGISSVDCFGGFEFWEMEFMIVDVPKSPVRSGSSGCSRFRLNVASPKNPASRMISVPLIFSSEL